MRTARETPPRTEEVALTAWTASPLRANKRVHFAAIQCPSSEQCLRRAAAAQPSAGWRINEARKERL